MKLTQEQKDALALVEQTGEFSIENLNEMNVPVNIFLSERRLSFDAFMPRKGRSFEGFSYTASSPEPLRKLVELFIKPFYVVAMKNVDGLIDGTKDSQYYWE